MSLPRYPEYTKTGYSWLPEAPSHWVICAPKRYVQSAAGGTLIKGQCAQEPADGLYPAFSASGQDVWVESFAYDRPGVVLSAVGARCGKAFKANGKWSVVANTHCLFPRDGADRDYLWYLANQEDWWEKGGTAQPFVKVSESLARSWAFPSLDEQRAIATFLDRETAKIDALIAEQEKLLALLAEKRQATISHAVTRGLNPNAPMKDSGIPWLGEVPAHWEVTRLKFIATVQTGIAKGKDIAGKETITVPYLRVANVQDGHLALEDVAMIDIEPEQLARYLLRKGDVLMNEGGDFDKLGRGALWDGQIEDCIHQNHVFAVRPHGISPRWLNQVTSSQYAQFYFMGRSKQSTNLASISSTNIMELPVVLPPAHEQEEILRFVEDESARSDALNQAAEHAIALLKERRSALISAAVTGKIDVRHAT